MEPFTRVNGLAAALPMANVDTDVIMPKSFLKGIDRNGLAIGLFHDLRFDERECVREDFLLNRPEMADTRFLVVGPNFGCGSSREHAVWGMLQYGIRAIIGTSFAGIFNDNAGNNGLLLITLTPEALAPITEQVAIARTELTIDLETQQIEMDGKQIPFEIDPNLRQSLMLGLDRVGTTLARADEIRSFEQSYLAENPWLTEDVRG